MADSRVEALKTVDFTQVIILDRPSLQIKENCQCNPLTMVIEGGGHVFGDVDIRFEAKQSTVRLYLTMDSKYSGLPVTISTKSSDGSPLTNTGYDHHKNTISLDLPDEVIQQETCTIEIRIFNLAIYDQEIEWLAPKSFTERSQSMFSDVFESEMFADFTLNVSGEEIKAHKVILASSSRYFKALFSSGMVESKTNNLSINDEEPEVIRAGLEFIYTGKLKKPGRDIFEGKDGELKKTNFGLFYSSLFLAADKYQIDGLKQECEKLLCDLVTTGSAGSILTIALDHKLDYLRDIVGRFLYKLDTRDGYFFNLKRFEYSYSPS